MGKPRILFESITKNYLKDMIDLFQEDSEVAAASPKIMHAYLRDTVWWYQFKMNWFYLKFQQTMNLQKKRGESS